MSASILLIVGVAMFVFGYFVYSRFVAKYILKLDDKNITPAHEFRDEIDYVPASKFVLWGHHFTAVAGAAPIVGPAIAVQWGWLPAFLWVVLGTVFFAGIHDMSALWASVKNQGKSIGNVCQKVIGTKIGQLFMVVIFLVLLMVNAAFGVIIAKESVEYPTTIIPAWGAILIALLMGQAIYRFKMNLALVTIVAVVLLYILVPIGVAYPVNLPENIAGLDSLRQWVVILFIYAGIASILPVWMLLQPRDYVNGVQLVIGLFLLYGSIVIINPTVLAPDIIPAIKAGDYSLIIPVLFITIACGAISGFHGIVASGTTSKQINKEGDVRFVGYLGAVGEGSLALGTIIACVAGVGLLSMNAGLNPETWTSLFKPGAGNFASGGGAIVANATGLSFEAASTLFSLMLILFAATTMDAGIRLQRYIIQEWGEIYKIPFLRKNVIATILAVGISFIMAMNGIGEGGKNEVAIWPLFGATNQILASLTLLTIAVILIKNKKIGGSLVVLVPLVFILIMAFWGALIKVFEFYNQGNWLLFVIDILVLIVTILVVLSALSTISKTLSNNK
ncbi:carbon starvation protein A [Campylobacter subantarcticus]|uniref:Carbon starvation protein A n=1 Tax=Campylobacter subantarcticus LMG 24374 TaxID=1388751 RepID=A0A0A8HEN3_9BACT|nr:carbon starvation protein A [Campylobacter subantarcticus]AJC91379.1 carbon starvation protein A [Campylobacter subantarcticus LMG 24374]EAJ1261027.1 carbon starvation protein A [Campylobacter lari]EAJ1262061.1 carbon starvation protein A [Campylobacter lari]